MTYFHPAWLEARRRRFTRPDGQRWIRPDAARFRKPKPYTPPDQTKLPQDNLELAAERAALLHLRSEIAALRAELKFRRMLRDSKANFNPAQPRWPAGNPDGGQWTDEGGSINDPRVLSDESSDPIRPSAQYAQDNTRRRYSVNLGEEEARGGHTLSKHVGKSDEELLDVLKRNYHVGVFSYQFQDAEGSFASPESANDFVNRVLENNKAIVDLVATGRLSRAMLEQRFGYVTGKEAFRPDVYSEPYMRNTYAARVVIRHDPLSDRGYTVLTAFPINQDPRKR